MNDACCQPSKQDRRGSSLSKGKVQSSSSAKNVKVLANTRQRSVDKTNKVGVEQSRNISSAEEFLDPNSDGADVMLMKSDTIKHISAMSSSDRGLISYKLIDKTENSNLWHS